MVRFFGRLIQGGIFPALLPFAFNFFEIVFFVFIRHCFHFDLPAFYNIKVEIIVK